MRRRVLVNSVNPVPQSMPVLKLWNDVNEFQAETMTLVEFAATTTRKVTRKTFALITVADTRVICTPVAMS